MAPRSTRIRWNPEERSTLLAAYQKLRLQDPKRGVAELFVAAQKALPPPRRRALDTKLRAWLEGNSQRGHSPHGTPPANAVGTASARPAPGRRRKRGKQALPPRVIAKPSAGSGEAPSRPRGAGGGKSVPPDSAAIAKAIVERGSEIVAEILESERVQQALRALLRSAWPTTATEAPAPLPRPPAGGADGGPPHAPATGALPTPVPASGKLRVLIAGMERGEGAALARTYDDTLELVCWSAEDGPELLPAALARADVVVGMTGVLSQPVEQTLRRHAKRYLRNARGVAGLRSELAGLALSGDGAAAVAPA